MLPFSFKFDKTATHNPRPDVCISGKLTSYKTKAEAHSKLQELGYVVKTSLTKGCHNPGERKRGRIRKN